MISTIKQWSWLRIFTSDKLIKSKLLNRLGIQIFRMRLAQWCYTWRAIPKGIKIPDEIASYVEKGYLQINHFLSYEEFEKVRSEFYQIKKQENWQQFSRKDGPNIIYMLSLRHLDKSRYPYLFRFLKNEKLNSLFSVAEKRKIQIEKDAEVQFQYLVQGENTQLHDSETDMHADTFFHTHKAWLYMDPVHHENAPFVYVPYTHTIDLPERLQKEYQFSLDIQSKGSRRVEESEILSFGHSEKVFTCEANTLVMANTFGYHRRLKGLYGHDRLTLAISVRKNPFRFF